MSGLMNRGDFDAERPLIGRTICTTDGPGRSLSATYVLELRRLIRENAYSTVEVADEIARRLLRSGEL
jgi:hypothetical protein